MRQLRNNLTVVFVSVLLAVGYAGWLFAGQTLRPITRMIRQVERISDKDLKTRLETGNNKDELARLAKTFNQMMDRIEQAFALQKGFISNASHEIGNPLTSITSQIEVALLKEREIIEYQQLLTSIHEDVERLNKLTKQLLVLGKTELDHAANFFESLQITDLLTNLIDSFHLKNANCQIQLHIGANIPTIKAHRDLMYSCFYNLLDNALKFSNDHRASVEVNSSKKELRIRISNSGIPLSETDQQRMFQPFYRASSARDATAGHGLGLSIVKNIVELHQGRVLVHVSSKITCLEVLFPYNF